MLYIHPYLRLVAYFLTVYITYIIFDSILSCYFPILFIVPDISYIIDLIIRQCTALTLKRKIETYKDDLVVNAIVDHLNSTFRIDKTIAFNHFCIFDNSDLVYEDIIAYIIGNFYSRPIGSCYDMFILEQLEYLTCTGSHIVNDLQYIQTAYNKRTVDIYQLCRLSRNKSYIYFLFFVLDNVDKVLPQEIVIKILEFIYLEK